MIKKIGFVLSLLLTIAPMASAAHITKECLDPFRQELRYGDGTRFRRPEMAPEVHKLQKVLNWDEDPKMWVRSRPAGYVGYPGYEGDEYLARTASAIKDFNKKWGILPTRTQERSGRVVATSTRDRLNQIIAEACGSTVELTMSEPVVSDVTQTSARVSFTTSVPTQAHVSYGPGLSMAASSSVALGTDHQVVLGNLLPNTTYNYKAIAWRSNGAVYSPEGAFATLPLFPATTTVSLFVTKSGTGAGVVTSSGGGINCGATCSMNVASGTSVTLTATPSAGSQFTGWSGGCSGLGSCTVTLSASRVVNASFSTTPASSNMLSVLKAGSGSGAVRGSSSPGIDCGSTCTVSYASGTVAYLFAAPSAGSVFTGWSGCDYVATSTCGVTMSWNRSVTAFFTLLSTSTATTTTQSAQTAYLASALQALAEAVERLRQLVFYGSH